MPRPPKVSLILPAKYDLKQGGTSQQTGEKEKKTQLVSKEEGIRTWENIWRSGPKQK